MSISVLRTTGAWWVQTPGGAARIDTRAATTRQLLVDRPAIEAAATIRTDAVSIQELELLSPITAPCPVVAQMTNFASHVKDSGGNPDAIPLTFFRKSSGSISGPYDDMIRPAHVQLLDHDVEIGLVFGRQMPVGSDITVDNLGDYIAGSAMSSNGK